MPTTQHKIEKNQRFIDIAMQELGDVERIFELALLNDISITKEIEPGTMIAVPEFDKSKRGVVQVFSNSSIWPASADTNLVKPSLPPGGIGFMKIRDVANPSIHDFIVS
jgi:hypothetical protein